MIRAAFICLALATCPVALNAVAPAAAQDRLEEKRRELESVERALATAREDRTALEAEIGDLVEDRAALNRQLVDTAAHVQSRESEVSALEARLEILGVKAQDLRTALQERRDVLAHLIAALQRMGQNPPPALLVHPRDALAAIRSAIALGGVVPQMRGQAEALIADLEELEAISTSIVADKARLESEATDLKRQQARLSLLTEIRRRQIESERGTLTALQEKAERLAENARSFEDLIGRMETEVAEFRSVRARNAATRAAEAEDGGTALTPDQYRSYFASLPKDDPQPVNPLVAKSDPNRIAPAIPFAEATGLLPLPARGAVVADYGDETGYGEVSQGLSIATRSEAQVVAPADGWVVYSGAFRSYRQLLIIDAGEGYHVVLAGMNRIDVGPGQFVLAGEPVGAMSGEPVQLASSVLADGFSQPVLYVELRKDGQAIDPTPWWAERAIGQG